MINQLAQQLEERRIALGVSFYRIGKDLYMNAATINAVFQKGQKSDKKVRGYNVKHLLDIAAYLGIGVLTFDNSQIKVTIEKSK